MKKMLWRFGALCVVTALVAMLPRQMRAQVAPAAASADLSSGAAGGADSAKTYLQLREQLQATQLAIATNRIEAEVSARAAMAEKLDAIKTALDAERERHHLAAERDALERTAREREQADRQHDDRTTYWIAIGVGGVALIALIAGPILQWRALNQLAQAVMARPHPGPVAMTRTAPAVSVSNEPVSQASGTPTPRIQEAINRMECRILELEHNVGRRSPTGSGATTSTYISAASNPRPVVPANQNSRIKLLLGNGHSLLMAGKAKEAIACYNEVLRLDLNHAEALVKRGAALEKLKQDDEAIQCYDRAIRADSKMTLAYLYKGGVCNRLERYEEANKCYEQALRMEDETRAAAHFPFTPV